MKYLLCTRARHGVGHDIGCNGKVLAGVVPFLLACTFYRILNPSAKFILNRYWLIYRPIYCQNTTMHFSHRKLWLVGECNCVFRQIYADFGWH
jgi:hypothetical protein